MEAKEFMKEYRRMCNSYTHCSDCNEKPSVCGHIPKNINDEEIDVVLKAVEKWSKEHPKKTRQSELLKHYPNAYKKNGHIEICPQKIDGTFKCEVEHIGCTECRRDFWLAEVEEKEGDTK